MSNMRILKKLSKKAAPLLPLLGDSREQFRAERHENYTGLLVMARKHWERGRSIHGDLLGELEIKYPAKDGKGFIYLHPPHHPRKGTVMVGAVEGYYEPEWEEQTAWEALQNIVMSHFTAWEVDAVERDVMPRMLRRLRTPAEIFRAAQEIITEAGRAALKEGAGS